MSIKLFITAEEQLTRDPASLGFVQDEANYGSMWVKDSSYDYAQPIVAVQVRSSAVDGPRSPRTFKTLERAIAYIVEEGWAHTGVSDDGVSRLDGFQVKIGDCHRWSYCPDPVRRFLMRCARIGMDSALKDYDLMGNKFSTIVAQP